MVFRFARFVAFHVRENRDYLAVIVLSATLAVSVINVTHGAYMSLVLFLLLAGARIAQRATFDSLDVVVLVSGLVLIVSPYWTSSIAPLGSASSSALGSAAGLLFMLPVRWLIRTKFLFFLLSVSVILISSTYALIVLSLGEAVQVADGVIRVYVPFANANYLSAIFAYGTALSIWSFIYWAKSAKQKVMFAAGMVIGIAAVFVSGSRAALGGIALAAIAIIALRKAPRVALYGAFTLAFASFIIGFFPTQAVSFLTAAAGIFEGSTTLSRDPDDINTASGREAIWLEVNEVITRSWLTGWGPGRYEDQSRELDAPAHNWGLEFMASVGIVGTLLLVCAIVIAYFARGFFRFGNCESTSWQLWNAGTLLAILPNLALSTHQWTLWAWLAVGLWSRSRSLLEAESVTRYELPSRAQPPAGS